MELLLKNNDYILDYKNRKRSGNSEILPHLFIDKIVFISPKSFQQTHIILANRIRKYVISVIKNYIIANYTIKNSGNFNYTIRNYNELICLGGESYFYALYLNYKFKFVTNNLYIKNDCIFNNKLYNKIHIKNSNFIDNFIYDYSNIPDGNFYIINMSNIYKNIVDKLLEIKPETIIIISCHHYNFWNRIKPLRKYYILHRKRFVCEKLRYFITVNIFRLANVIPFGGNCSVAYMLKYYNIRKKANLFDWCKISIYQLYNVISNYNDKKTREDFLTYKSCRESNHDVFEEHGNILYKNNMNIIFANNTNTEKRFYSLDKENIYIRLETSSMTNNMKKEYKKLFRILNGKFILISDKPIFNFGFYNYENMHLWNIKLEYFDSDWKYSGIIWYKIFKYIYEG